MSMVIGASASLFILFDTNKGISVMDTEIYSEVIVSFSGFEAF